MEAQLKGVRLIHVFEYELKNITTAIKILQYIKDIISQPTNIIYARNTSVVPLNREVALEFLNKYHLQGFAEAEVNLGCIYNGELVGLMSFGRPRFSDECEYELIRAVWKSGYSVVGGSEKLFDYFIKSEYNPKSIVSYCNIAKFTGKSYRRLGFKVDKITEPNYFWVKEDKALPRYQTTKRDLLDAGLGTDEDTEDSIMERLGYLKVYDCGNYKFIWNR